jgi:ribose 5-phosphate isomerase RpiB
MCIGMAAVHGGYEWKVQLTAALLSAGYEVADVGGL